MLHIWELMKLISENQSHLCDSKEHSDSDIDTESDDEVFDTSVTHSCFFCGRVFKNKRALDTHLRTCDEKQ